MSFFDKIIGGIEFITKSIAWIRIFLAPTLFGFLLGIGFAIYLNSIYSLYLFIGFFLSGILVGIYFAERIRKKHGTVEFMSRIEASPDLDKTNEN